MRQQKTNKHIDRQLEIKTRENYITIIITITNIERERDPLSCSHSLARISSLALRNLFGSSCFTFSFSLVRLFDGVCCYLNSNRMPFFQIIFSFFLLLK